MSVSLEEVIRNVTFFLSTIGHYGILLFKPDPTFSTTEVVPVLLRSGPWRRTLTKLDIDASGKVVRGTVAERKLTEIESAFAANLRNFPSGMMVNDDDVAMLFLTVEATNVDEEQKAAFASTLVESMRELIGSKRGLLGGIDPFSFRDLDEHKKMILERFMSIGLPMEDKQRVLLKLFQSYITMLKIPANAVQPTHVDKVAAMYCQVLLHVYSGLDLPPPRKIDDFGHGINVSVSTQEWNAFFPSVKTPIGEDAVIISLVLFALGTSTYYASGVGSVSHTR